MVLMPIVTGAYKPTYNWGASHCIDDPADTATNGPFSRMDGTWPIDDSPIKSMAISGS